jgi:hypothetical protein
MGIQACSDDLALRRGRSTNSRPGGLGNVSQSRCLGAGHRHELPLLVLDPCRETTPLQILQIGLRVGQCAKCPSNWHRWAAVSPAEMYRAILERHAPEATANMTSDKR